MCITLNSSIDRIETNERIASEVGLNLKIVPDKVCCRFTLDGLPNQGEMSFVEANRFLRKTDDAFERKLFIDALENGLRSFLHLKAK